MKKPDKRSKTQPSRTVTNAIPEQPAEPAPEHASDLMPDIYSEVNADTVPQINILEDPPTGDDESAGFNPYDTGVLRKKR